MKITNITTSNAAHNFYLIFETPENNYSIHLPFPDSALRFRKVILNRTMKLVEQGWEIEDFLRLTKYITYFSMQRTIQFFMSSGAIKDKTFYIEHCKIHHPNEIIVSYEPSDNNQTYRWIFMSEKKNLGCLTDYIIHE